MPNLVAYFALFAWPLVALVLFRVMPLQRALVWTVVGGHLLLPSATYFKIPLIPELDRTSVVSVSAFVLCLLHAKSAGRLIAEGKSFGRFLVVALVVAAIFGPIPTVLFNSEPLVYGPRLIPGLSAKDAGGQMIQTALMLLPFWLGLRFLNTVEGHLELVKALAIAGVVYSFPALLEIRLSPKLHIWVYGFFQHDFSQHMRLGGFRPVVFLAHGLVLGIFLCASFLAALALAKEARNAGKASIGWILAAAWLFLVLFVSKNLGALAIGIAVAGFFLLTSRRTQVIFAVTVAVAVLTYPLLRGAGWFPVEGILERVERMDTDRASSLRFRFMNEEELLDRANEKPGFGWGNWGRNQIFDPDDGTMRSVTDGTWVIFIGVYGWVGYIARFGLFAVPIIYYAVYRRSLGTSYATQGLVLILSAALIDLIPNSGLVVYVWLMAGAIAGYALWKPAREGQSLRLRDVAAPRDAQSSIFTAAPGQAAWLMQPKSDPTSRRARRKGSEQRT